MMPTPWPFVLRAGVAAAAAAAAVAPLPQEQIIWAGRGAVDLYLPKGYRTTGCESYPLVIQLHGYHLDATTHDSFFGLGDVINRHRVIVAKPNGRVDLEGNRYWMAWGEWTGSCSPELLREHRKRSLQQKQDADRKRRADSYDDSHDDADSSYEEYSYDHSETQISHDGEMTDTEILESEAEEKWHLAHKNPTFWWQEAIDHCSGPNDDVEYIKALVAKISSKYRIDRTRVSALGHSNGAAMAYRLLCDAPDIFSSGVIIAGTPPMGNFTCNPKKHVRLLHIQGTRDDITLYDGGFNEQGEQEYLSAPQSVELFMRKNGCARPLLQPTAKTSSCDNHFGRDRFFDLSYLPIYADGRETQVYDYTGDGCPRDGQVTLWKVCGETHLPLFEWAYSKKVAEFLTWYSNPNVDMCPKLLGSETVAGAMESAPAAASAAAAAVAAAAVAVAVVIVAATALRSRRLAKETSATLL